MAVNQLLTVCCLFAFVVNAKKPNVIMITTDDQDYTLDSMKMMKHVHTLIGEQGTIFENMFVDSPVCCPSRATILSGRYLHNHKTKNCTTNGGCNSEFWQKHIEPTAIPVHMQKAGYTTFFAGKYLNQFEARKPPGWDQFYASIQKPKFYDYDFFENGKIIHYNKTDDDHLEKVIKRHSLNFLNSFDTSNPFFMYICPKSPHLPAVAPKEYLTMFGEAIAPRTPAWNYYGADKHWIMRQAYHPMTSEMIEQSDQLLRKRWQTLQSVDDLVKSIVQSLQEKEELDNTVIIYTSDNGYHLGQFCFPWTKYYPYEFDIRVPLYVRGPGIIANTIRYEPVANVDLAPTILSFAGIEIPKFFDGQSFKPLLEGHKPKTWRADIVVQYYGQDGNALQKPGKPPKCPNQPIELARCFNKAGCLTCADGPNNTYSCIRRLSKTENYIYCEFYDDENFKEYYDLVNDPFQLNNTMWSLDEITIKKLSKQLNYLKQCIGAECRATGLPSVQAKATCFSCITIYMLLNFWMW